MRDTYWVSPGFTLAISCARDIAKSSLKTTYSQQFAFGRGSRLARAISPFPI